jgi:superfamily II DNA or RNA helicase
VLKALEAKRSPVVPTERRGHLEYLQKRFSRIVRNLVGRRGGMSDGERKAAEAALRVADGQERLILAPGRYFGQGFDGQKLDTLFLTMPISWRGTLANMLGKKHGMPD